MRATTRYTIKKFIHSTFNRRAQAKAARARLEAIRHHNGGATNSPVRISGVTADVAVHASAAFAARRST